MVSCVIVELCSRIVRGGALRSGQDAIIHIISWIKFLFRANQICQGQLNNKLIQMLIFTTANLIQNAKECNALKISYKKYYKNFAFGWANVKFSVWIHIGPQPWLSQAWGAAEPIFFQLAVSCWFRCRNSHERNSLNSIYLVWSTAFELGLRWGLHGSPPCPFALGWATWKFASANQNHYPDLGNDMSSVYNFCARFSDVVSPGNQWWCRKKSAVFSG